MMDARTIATLARSVSEDEAAELIEQYARNAASEARVAASVEAYHKIELILARNMNGPGAR